MSVGTHVEHMGGGHYVADGRSEQSVIDNVRARHASATSTSMDEVEAEIVDENNKVFTVEATP